VWLAEAAPSQGFGASSLLMSTSMSNRGAVPLSLCALWLCACGASSTSGQAHGVPAEEGTADAGDTPLAHSTGPTLAYVGTAEGPISWFTLEPATGRLTFLKSIDAGLSPTFLAVNPGATHLYAVNEGSAQLAAFAIEPSSGALTFLNRVSTGGDSPAHVSVDPSGRYVMVANYTGGSVRLFPIAADGRLAEPSDSRSTGKWAHMIVSDPLGHFVFVPNKGSDTISQFRLDAVAGRLVPNEVATVATAAGAGPRHLAFHPNGKWVFSINELDDTLSAFAFDNKTGQLDALQTLSTLPPGTDGASNSCAEVVVAPSGNFVYGSNRGHDSIVTFSVEPTSGRLTFLGTTASGGKIPRSFTLSTDGKLMLVANESGNITTFLVDTNSGALLQQQSVEVAHKPQFVGLVTLADTVTRAD
jgi:6-phosphogluconolactonase